MRRVKLGGALEVSDLCLGSMTWGSQNTVAEGCAQIDRALERGVDFIDTAEMYPTTPIRAETTGDTERVIGEWIATRKGRDRIVLASKVIGDGYEKIRDGGPISPASIDAALETSLRNLRTDYVDLYQLHWPNRGSYHFRKSWGYDPSRQPDAAAIRGDIEGCLRALERHVQAGKIRHIGLSNETAWGVSQFTGLATAAGLPRVISIQNEYSLLCRAYDTDLAEAAHHERVDLLAYSALAAGLLTGKYAADQTPPEGSRGAINPQLGGRWTDAALEASAAYAGLARRHDLEPATLAYAFCRTRPFMGSVIIGATTPEQLDVALDAGAVTLSDEILAEIDSLHRRYPKPF